MERLRAISVGLLRLVVVAVAVFVATTVLMSAPTTTANAATFTYDTTSGARVDVLDIGTAEAPQIQLSHLSEGSNPPCHSQQTPQGPRSTTRPTRRWSRSCGLVCVLGRTQHRHRG